VLRKWDERGRTLGEYFGSRKNRRDGLTSPLIVSGTTIENPNVVAHKRPKKPVMIFELLKTARTRMRNNNEFNVNERTKVLPMIYKRA